MTNEEQEAMGKLIGELYGTIGFTLVAMIHATPNFDKHKFIETLQERIQHPETSETQKQFWLSFVDVR